MVSGLHPTVCWSPSLAQLRVIWEEAPHFTTAVPVLSSSTCNSLCLVIADMATVSISWASGFSQNMKPARQRETLPKFMPIIILLYKQSCCFALRKKKKKETQVLVERLPNSRECSFYSREMCQVHDMSPSVHAFSSETGRKRQWGNPACSSQCFREHAGPERRNQWFPVAVGGQEAAASLLFPKLQRNPSEVLMCCLAMAQFWILVKPSLDRVTWPSS